MNKKHRKPKQRILLKTSRQLYKLSETEDDQNGILNSLIIKANIYWSITDFKMALVFAEKAKELAEELNMQKELALALQVEGLIYNELSNLERSSGIFFNSLRLFEQINDKEGVSRLLSYIGSVYYYQYNYEKALLPVHSEHFIIDFKIAVNHFFPAEIIFCPLPAI